MVSKDIFRAISYLLLCQRAALASTSASQPSSGVFKSSPLSIAPESPPSRSLSESSPVSMSSESPPSRSLSLSLPSSTFITSSRDSFDTNSSGGDSEKETKESPKISSPDPELTIQTDWQDSDELEPEDMSRINASRFYRGRRVAAAEAFKYLDITEILEAEAAENDPKGNAEMVGKGKGSVKDEMIVKEITIADVFNRLAGLRYKEHKHPATPRNQIREADLKYAGSAQHGGLLAFLEYVKKKEEKFWDPAITGELIEDGLAFAVEKSDWKAFALLFDLFLRIPVQCFYRHWDTHPCIYDMLFDHFVLADLDTYVKRPYGMQQMYSELSKSRPFRVQRSEEILSSLTANLLQRIDAHLHPSQEGFYQYAQIASEITKDKALNSEGEFLALAKYVRIPMHLARIAFALAVQESFSDECVGLLESNTALMLFIDLSFLLEDKPFTRLIRSHALKKRIVTAAPEILPLLVLYAKHPHMLSLYFPELCEVEVLRRASWCVRMRHFDLLAGLIKSLDKTWSITVIRFLGTALPFASTQKILLNPIIDPKFFYLDSIAGFQSLQALLIHWWDETRDRAEGKVKVRDEKKVQGDDEIFAGKSYVIICNRYYAAVPQASIPGSPHFDVIVAQLMLEMPLELKYKALKELCSFPDSLEPFEKFISLFDYDNCFDSLVWAYRERAECLLSRLALHTVTNIDLWKLRLSDKSKTEINFDEHFFPMLFSPKCSRIITDPRHLGSFEYFIWQASEFYTKRERDGVISALKNSLKKCLSKKVYERDRAALQKFYLHMLEMCRFWRLASQEGCSLKRHFSSTKELFSKRKGSRR